MVEKLADLIAQFHTILGRKFVRREVQSDPPYLFDSKLRRRVVIEEERDLYWVCRDLDTGEEVFSYIKDLYHLTDEMKAIWPLAVNCTLDQGDINAEHTAFAECIFRDMFHECDLVKQFHLKRVGMVTLTYMLTC